MTATNHALTGACIGFLVSDPLLALPLAVLSHFVCDAIPHFDSSLDNDLWLKSKRFKILLITDASLCVIFVAILAIVHPRQWVQAAVCAFLATSPDLVWINRYYHLKKNRPWKASSFSVFAARIQWFAKPIGGIVEALWCAAGIILVSMLVRT